MALPAKSEAIAKLGIIWQVFGVELFERELKGLGDLGSELMTADGIAALELNQWGTESRLSEVLMQDRENSLVGRWEDEVRIGSKGVNDALQGWVGAGFTEEVGEDGGIKGEFGVGSSCVEVNLDQLPLLEGGVFGES